MKHFKIVFLFFLLNFSSPTFGYCSSVIFTVDITDLLKLTVPGKKLILENNKSRKLLQTENEALENKLLTEEKELSELRNTLSTDEFRAKAIQFDKRVTSIRKKQAKKEEDLILISDVDEIPNLEELEISKINQKIIMFKQEMFYYKFNLKLPNFNWTGTKACKKKYLKSPQWLRNIKDRKYSLYRFDVLFSQTKFIDLKIIENGGWHFTNLKSAEEIEHKLRSYLHHREFDVNPISINEIKNIIKNKIAIYDLTLDKRTQKIGHGKKLEKYPLDRLPKFLQDNLHNYQEWID